MTMQNTTAYSRGKKALCTTFALALMAGLLPQTALVPSEALAAEDTGAFTVTGGTQGADYDFSDGVLTIKTNKSLTIKNDNPRQTTDRIFVSNGVSANLTLAGVNISQKDTGGQRGYGKWDYGNSALEIAEGSSGNVTITLAAGTTN